MKKFFAIAAMAAMLIACGEPEENKPAGGENNGGGNTEETYVDPIKVDGDFADWDALDASKVVEAVGATDAYYAGLTKVRIYADDLFINILLESNVDTNDAEAMAVAYYVNVLLNADNNQATGGYAEIWTDAGVDCLMQGWIWDGSTVGSYDPGCYAWNGEAGASGWNWDVDGALVAEGSGLASGAGTVAKYEIKIVKDMIPLDLATPFTMGIGFSKAWDTYGLLPNAPVTEEFPGGAGNAAMFVVE